MGEKVKVTESKGENGRRDLLRECDLADPGLQLADPRDDRK